MMQSKNGHMAIPRTFSRSFLLTLAVGICFGFSFAYILLSVVAWEKADFLAPNSYLYVGTRPQGYISTVPSRDHGHNHGHSMDHDVHDHKALENAAGPSEPVSFHDHHEGTHIIAIS